MLSIGLAFALIVYCTGPKLNSSFKYYSSSLFRLSSSSRRKLKDNSAKCISHSNEKIYLKSAWKELQVKFNCSEIDSDELSDMLIELGVSGVGVEPLTENTELFSNERNWQTVEQQQSWTTALIRAHIPTTYNIELLTTIIDKLYGKDRLDIELFDVEDKDWVKHVQESWSPITTGNLTVLLPWHNESTATISRYKLYLEGGVAFGTGDHPTTRQCCERLERIIVNGDTEVLDFGCGSGILGLGKFKLSMLYDINANFISKPLWYLEPGLLREQISTNPP